MKLSHKYVDRTVDLEFFLVNDWDGEPDGMEGQELRWVNVSQLNAAELLPADAPLVQALRDTG